MSAAPPDKRVLVLYTGGTIGMKNTENGYAPAKGYLTEQMYVVAPLLMKNVTVIDYDPLLDSCNMSHTHWQMIAGDIRDRYEQFDSFVIVHGTDTMAYTASGLAFMLENLSKPVIITGSQIPLCELRNDARSNLIGALELAMEHRIPEVCIYFNNKLFRGCRSRKTDCSSMAAFESPNHHPLAELDVNIKVHWDRIWRNSTKKPLAVNMLLSSNIIVLQLYPGITSETVEGILHSPTLQGVVLLSYGAGNIDTSNVALLDALKRATDRGIVIVNCTQCDRGTVMAIYETGQALLKVGVIPGYDMTTEAALAKLSFLLGSPNYPREQIPSLMAVSLRGELSEPNERLDLKNNDFLRAVGETLRLTDEEDRDKLYAVLGPVLACAYAAQNDISGLADLDTNCCDYDARTPLHVSAACGHVACTEYLLERGADWSALDVHGHTPLRDAVDANHDDVAERLYAAGARLTTDPGLLCECARSNNLTLLKRLVRFGMDPTIGDYDGRTPLHLSLEEGFEEISDFIRGLFPSSPTKRDRWGNTPGHSGGHMSAIDSGLQLVDASSVGHNATKSVYDGLQELDKELVQWAKSEARKTSDAGVRHELKKRMEQNQSIILQLLQLVLDATRADGFVILHALGLSESDNTQQKARKVNNAITVLGLGLDHLECTVSATDWWEE